MDTRRGDVDGDGHAVSRSNQIGRAHHRALIINRLNHGSYTFLGFSENHVKDGRVVFFREDETWTVNRLLAQFGDLESVYQQHGYGKYAARLGLSFSSTAESLDVGAPWLA